jgi:hypothetical protein
MRAVVNCVAGSVENSSRPCLCTSHVFSNFQHRLKMILRTRKTVVPLPFSLIVMSFDKVAVGFM